MAMVRNETRDTKGGGRNEARLKLCKELGWMIGVKWRIWLWMELVKRRVLLMDPVGEGMRARSMMFLFFSSFFFEKFFCRFQSVREAHQL